MKKLATLLICALLSMSVFAQKENIYVPIAGLLAGMLGDRAETVEDLTIGGILNGSDVITMRQMLTEGKLTKLNLKRAEFMPSKVVYYIDENGVEYKTSSYTLGGYMFADMTQLQEIVLPENTWVIGEAAFLNCTGLTTVTTSADISNINKRAFKNCENLASPINLPKVNMIEDETFANCFKLPALSFGEDKIVIDMGLGKNALLNCRAITKIDFPEGMTILKAGALSGTGITNVQLPQSVTSLAEGVFENCNSLETVYLHKLVQLVGESAFAGCTKLKQVSVENLLPPTIYPQSTFDAETYTSATLLVPMGSKSLYETANVWKSFTKIEEMKDTVVVNVAVAGTLNTLLVEDQTLIKKLVLSGQLNGTDIQHLRKLAKENQLAYIDMSNARIVAGGDAYYTKDDAKYFTANDVLGEYMFQGITYLRAVDMPKQLSEIGKNAFAECYNLQQVTIPEGIASLPEFVFASTSLQAINLPKSLTSIEQSAFSNSKLPAVILPEGLLTIGESAFASSGLVEISIPTSIQTIGKGAFSKNSLLEKVTLPQGLKTISAQSFEHCISLKAIDIPASVVTIEDGAFQECENLRNVNFEGSALRTIERRAFFFCKALTDLSFPKGLTSIGKEAFYECSAITVVNIPEGVTEIGDFAFFEATNLKSIYLPESLETIGSSAFFGYMTDQLTKVYSNGVTPPVCRIADVFNYVTTTFGVLYVPLGTSNAYRSAEMWQEFFTIQEMNFTGIETESPDAQTTVIGRVGDILIETSLPAQVSIYTLTGVEVSTTTVEAGETAIDLASGMYIVKVGTEARKVVVR